MQNELEIARDMVMTNLEKGVECPCCGQLCKLYKRALNAQMARFLIWIVKEHERDPRWINIHESIVIQGRRGGGDFAKLAHWDLLEEKPNTDDSQRTSGYWRPTLRGNDFVYNKVIVPSHVYIFDNHIHGFSETFVTIFDALGKAFNYAELMRNS